jgi:hypothetical protein
MQVVLKNDVGPVGRSTILLDGVQIGYFRPRMQLIQFAPNHVDEDTAAAVVTEIEKQTNLVGIKVGTNPPPEPPEWAETDNVAPAEGELAD